MLKAHAIEDNSALIGLYTEAGEQAPEEIARGFYLTHAFIYALEAGDARASALHASLKAMGRV
nr:hypothetical protein [Lentibacter algarum]